MTTALPDPPRRSLPGRTPSARHAERGSSGRQPPQPGETRAVPKEARYRRNERRLAGYRRSERSTQHSEQFEDPRHLATGGCLFSFLSCYSS